MTLLWIIGVVLAVIGNLLEFKGWLKGWFRDFLFCLAMANFSVWSFDNHTAVMGWFFIVAIIFFTVVSVSLDIRLFARLRTGRKDEQ